MSISKIDVVRNHIDAAIFLLFNGNPVSAHTLAWAADQILHDIQVSGSMTRSPYTYSLRGEFHILIKDEYHGEIAKLLNKEYNFFKHADRDSDSLLDFDERALDIPLMIISEGYLKLGFDSTHRIKIFKAWFMSLYPRFIKSDDLLKARLIDNSKFVDDWTREEKIRLGQIMMEVGLGDQKLLLDRVVSEILDKRPGQVIRGSTIPLPRKAIDLRQN